MTTGRMPTGKGPLRACLSKDLGQGGSVDSARERCGISLVCLIITSCPRRQTGRCGTRWGCDWCPGDSTLHPLLQSPASGCSPPLTEVAVLRESLSSLSYSATHWQVPVGGREGSWPFPFLSPSPVLALPSSLIICARTEPQVGFRSDSTCLSLLLPQTNACPRSR